MNVENSTVDLRMAQRMTSANFKSPPLTVREEFLGQTDIHTHLSVLYYRLTLRANWRKIKNDKFIYFKIFTHKNK